MPTSNNEKKPLDLVVSALTVAPGEIGTAATTMAETMMDAARFIPHHRSGSRLHHGPMWPPMPESLGRPDGRHGQVGFLPVRADPLGCLKNLSALILA
jgi:hypothetical protein